MEDHDLSVIYTREDGSYVIDQGMFHVPQSWEDLWKEVDAYAKEHPESVRPEPTGDEDEPVLTSEPSLEERLTNIEDALVKLADMLTEGE